MSLVKKRYSWPLIGNQNIIEFLEAVLARRAEDGFYIFNGPDNLGKTTLARQFAKILKCEQKDQDVLPCDNCFACKALGKKGVDVFNDFSLVKCEKDKKNISIKQIRELSTFLSMTSMSGGHKIGIIKHAEKLSIEAANALLKNLEEPKKGVVIILITNSIESLPQTVASRAKILNFKPVKSSVVYDYLLDSCGASRDQAKVFSRLAMGRPALAKKFFESNDFYDNYRLKVNMFLSIMSEDSNKAVLEIDELFKDTKKENQENVKITFRVLEVWQALIRDILFISYSNEELLVHIDSKKDLVKFSEKYSKENLLNLLKNIKTGEGYLKNNVNPKLVLQNILFNV